MNKLFAAASVVIVAIAVGGFVAYDRYQDAQFRQLVLPIVKGATVRVTDALLLGWKEKITFEEGFARLESHLKDLDAAMLKLKELSPKGQNQTSIASTADVYLQQSQQIVRAMRERMKKAYGFTVQAEIRADWARELVTSSGLARWNERMESTKVSYNEAAGAVKENREGVIALLDAAIAAHPKFAAEFTQAEVVGIAELQALLNGLKKETGPQLK